MNVQEMAAEFNGYLDRIGTAHGKQTEDVVWALAEIKRLNETPGTFSQVDQAIVDGLIARLSETATKAEELDQMIEDRPPTS